MPHAQNTRHIVGVLKTWWNIHAVHVSHLTFTLGHRTRSRIQSLQFFTLGATRRLGLVVTRPNRVDLWSVQCYPDFLKYECAENPTWQVFRWANLPTAFQSGFQFDVVTTEPTSSTFTDFPVHPDLVRCETSIQTQSCSETNMPSAQPKTS